MNNKDKEQIRIIFATKFSIIMGFFDPTIFRIHKSKSSNHYMVRVFGNSISPWIKESQCEELIQIPNKFKIIDTIIKSICKEELTIDYKNIHGSRFHRRKQLTRYKNMITYFNNKEKEFQDETREKMAFKGRI